MARGEFELATSMDQARIGTVNSVCGEFATPRLLAISQYEIYSDRVHVITRKRLREFAARHKDAEGPLGAWYAIVSKTDFASFSQVKQVFRSADKVGKFTVFDIGGNKFRLIAAMHYNRKKLYIRHVLTHAEYDKGNWKEQ